MARFRIDVGASTGTPDRSRNDGVDNVQVTLTSLDPAATHTFRIVTSTDNSPPTVTSTGTTTATFTPSNGPNSYLIELETTGPNEIVRRTYRIPALNTGLLYPTPNEGADPTATLQNASTPAIVAASNDNEGGNAFGWSNAAVNWFYALDDIFTELEVPAGNDWALTQGGNDVFRYDQSAQTLQSALPLSLAEQASPPTASTDRGQLYTQDVSGSTELFYRNTDGTVQLTGVAASVDLQAAYNNGNAITLSGSNAVEITSPVATATAMEVTGTVTLVGPTQSTVVGGAIAGVTSANQIFGNSIDAGSNGFIYGFGGDLTFTSGASVGIGFNAVIPGDSVVVGVGSGSVGDQSVTVGRGATAAATGSVAIGRSAGATAANSISLGRDASVSASGGIAVGRQSDVTGGDGIAIGRQTSSVGEGVAVGLFAVAGDTKGTAVGHDTQALATQSTALGHASEATNSNDIAIGHTPVANGPDAVAIGTSAAATAEDAIALGNSANADGADSMAAGRNASAPTTDSLAIGRDSVAGDSVAGSNESTALGTSSTATGNRAVAVGFAAEATQNECIAIGENARTTAANQAVIGGSITELAIGYGAESSTPQSNVRLTATSAEATSGQNGTNLQLRGGLGDGAGTDGYIELLSAVQANGGVGASGQVLTSRGAGLSPEWTTVSSGGSGEANTASNLGSGAEVFAQKTGVDLEFRSFVGGTGITVTEGTDEITIDRDAVGLGDLSDVDLTGAAQGAILYRGATEWVVLAPGTSGQVLQTQGTGADPQWAAAGEANTASNVGSGEGIFAQKTGVDLEFKSLVAGANISLSGGTTEVTIATTGVVTGGTSLGSGEDVFVQDNAGDLEFNSLAGGTGITLSTAANVITIDRDAIAVGDLSDVTVTGGATGDILYRDAGGDYVNLGIGTNGQVLTVASGVPSWAAGGGGSGEANTASNVGTGEEVFAQKTGVDLEFKSLVAGQGLTVTSTSTEVSYTLDAGLGDLSNVTGFPISTSLPIGSYESTTQTTSSNLEAADNASLQVNTSFSVSFWMRPDAQQNQVPLVGKGVNTSGAEGWNIGMHFSQGSNGAFWVELEQTSGGMGGSGYFNVTGQNDQFRANEWTHHVFVIDFAPSTPTCVVYSDGGAGASSTGKTVNATLSGTPASTRTDNTEPLRIGGGSGFYSGFNYSITLNMADVTVWDGTLTAADAEALYNNGGLLEPTALTGLSASPLYYYPIRDATTLTDQTGSAPTLTAQGTMAPSTAAPSGGSQEGAFLYRGPSAWTPLDPGTSGQVLETQGPGAAPQWVSPPGETNTASNLGSGSDVFAQKSGVDFEFRSIVGGTNITVSQSATEITVDSDITTLGSLDDVAGSPPSAGDLLYRGVSGTWVQRVVGASDTVLVGGSSPSYSNIPLVEGIRFNDGVQAGTGASDGGEGTSVAVGRLATVGAPEAIAVGAEVSVGLNGTKSTAIGYNANVNEFRSIAIGESADVVNSGSIAIGAGSASTASNQCTLGGPGNARVEELVVGGQPDDFFFPPTNILVTTVSGESTTNQDGSNLQLRAGLGAGTGDDGYIEILSALRTDSSVGSDGQVLVSNGAGAAPSWVDLTSDYAGCYAASNATATSVSSTGTFFTIAGMSNTTPSNISSSGSSATLTAGATGTYKIDWHVYISGGLAGELDVGVLQNTSLVDGGLSQGQNDPDTDSQQQAGSVIVDATSSDVFELALRSSTATGSTTVVSGTFTLVRIA